MLQQAQHNNANNPDRGKNGYPYIDNLPWKYTRHSYSAVVRTELLYSCVQFGCENKIHIIGEKHDMNFTPTPPQKKTMSGLKNWNDTDFHGTNLPAPADPKL